MGSGSHSAADTAATEDVPNGAASGSESGSDEDLELEPSALLRPLRSVTSEREEDKNERFRASAKSAPCTPSVARPRGLNSDGHFPVYTETVEGNPNMHKRQRCVRCTAAGRGGTKTTVKCERCNVPLCIGSCWRDYHSLRDLKIK